MAWQIRKEREDSVDLTSLLREGWEPFAITNEEVFDNPERSWRATGNDNFVWVRKESEYGD